jgi:hypothetical protein
VKVKRDRLKPEELLAFKQPLYEPGLPYIWTLTFGWACVGFYVRHETPLRIRVAHANYFKNAQKSYADLARTGGATNTEWRYLGNYEITVPHIIGTGEYLAEVPRGPIL